MRLRGIPANFSFWPAIFHFAPIIHVDKFSWKDRKIKWMKPRALALLFSFFLGYAEARETRTEWKNARGIRQFVKDDQEFRINIIEMFVVKHTVHWRSSFFSCNFFLSVLSPGDVQKRERSFIETIKR